MRQAITCVEIAWLLRKSNVSLITVPCTVYGWWLGHAIYQTAVAYCRHDKTVKTWYRDKSISQAWLWWYPRAGEQLMGKAENLTPIYVLKLEECQLLAIWFPDNSDFWNFSTIDSHPDHGRANMTASNYKAVTILEDLAEYLGSFLHCRFQAQVPSIRILVDFIRHVPCTLYACHTGNGWLHRQNAMWYCLLPMQHGLWLSFAGQTDAWNCLHNLQKTRWKTVEHVEQRILDTWGVMALWHYARSCCHYYYYYKTSSNTGNWTIRTRV